MTLSQTAGSRSATQTSPGPVKRSPMGTPTPRQPRIPTRPRRPWRAADSHMIPKSPMPTSGSSNWETRLPLGPGSAQLSPQGKEEEKKMITTAEEGDPKPSFQHRPGGLCGSNSGPSQEDIGTSAGRVTGAQHLTGCPRGSWECDSPGSVRRRGWLNHGRGVRLLSTGASEEAEDRSGCSRSRQRQRERIQMGRPGRKPGGRAGPGNLGGKEAGPGHSATAQGLGRGPWA